MSTPTTTQPPQTPNPFAVANQPETLQSLLRHDAYRKRFEQVLGERAPQFISSILSLGTTMPDVEPRSILAGAAIAASLDLPIDKNLGFAWIVPYKKGDRKLAQFQMGYRGYVQLALRTAAYERMNAKPINAEALNGYDSVGEPVIDWSKLDETKPEVGYVFAFQLVNGFVKCCYWPKTKVEAHAQRYSQSYRGGYESPWKTHFTQMALKTVIANELRHWGILSVQTQMAFREDQGMRKDIDVEVEFPEAADQVSGAKFDAREEKAEAAAGLAPAQQQQGAVTQPAAAAPAPAEQGSGMTPAQERMAKARAARAAKPASPIAPAAPAPALAQQPAATVAPAPPVAQPVAAVVQPPPPQVVTPAPELFQQPAAAAAAAAVAPPPNAQSPEAKSQELAAAAYQMLADNGITEAEVLAILKYRNVCDAGTEQLVQLPDEILEDLVVSKELILAQVRIERKRKK